MRRRTLLAAVGTAAASTAGCASLSLGGDTNAAADGESDTTTTATRWGDDPPCPAFDDDADAVRCSGAHPAVDYAGSDAVLRPRDTVFRLDADEWLRFDLRSHDGETLTFNPQDWALHWYDWSGWTKVAPDQVYDPLWTLPADETFTWSLATERRPTTTEANVVPAVASLSPGRYAFSVTVSVGEEWTEGRRVECNALFAVQRASSSVA